MTEEQRLLSMLERGTSPFQVVREAERQLEEKGFEKLEMGSKWELHPGGKYYLVHHGACFAAFCVPEKKIQELRIAAAHTDYPCLRIKPNPDMINGGYRQLNVEVYGGMINNTWLDRPLGISGRVAVRGRDAFHPEMRLYESSRPLLVIPNLAIHMNREVNKGTELNRQTDLLPVAGMETEEGFSDFLAKEMGLKKEDILDYELTVFCTEKPEITGFSEEFISSPRLDNLTSVQALLEAAGDMAAENALELVAAFDHEEIGSRTKQGAGSMFLKELVERVLSAAGIMDQEERIRLCYDGMMLSVDVAHALHPNQMGKADPTNRPVLNGGVCIKEAAAQSYATDSEAVAVVKGICEQARVPYQIFVNRSDMPGGSTIGSIASSFLPMKTTDIGVPILAMHSAREFMGREDMKALTGLIKGFFAF